MTGQWAPDPYGRAEYRWWDGTQWTSHVTRGGQVMQEDAASVATAPPVPSGAPVQPVPNFPGIPGAPPFIQNSAPTAAAKTNGMLVTASVLQLIQGVFGAIFGLWLLAAAQTDLGGLLDEVSGGALTMIGLVVTAISTVLIVVSVQTMRRRRGAWITLVVLQSIAAFLMVLGFIGSLADGDGGGGGVIPVLYVVVTLVLAIVGGRRQFSSASSPR